MESSDSSTEAVIETLTTGGWSFSDFQRVRAIIMIQSALADDRGSSAVANAVESELLNTDLRSVGGKSLPENRKISHIQGPKVLQISSVRDISRSSLEEYSGNSSSDRLLKFVLTDGHGEITGVEYSRIPSIPNDIIPGTKVRLENKVVLHSGILCLNPKSITVLGGVVQELHEEWQMNRKYSAFSCSSLKPSHNGVSEGPPPFRKLEIGAPVPRFSQQGSHGRGHVETTLKATRLDAVEAVDNTEVKLNTRQQAAHLKTNNMVNVANTASAKETTDEKPSSSQKRPKEVVESFPVQNQAASQKLLQKISDPHRNNQYSRGRKYRGKGKEEEQQVFTLDEYEKRKAGVKPVVRKDGPDTSCDHDLAWELQNQLDLEDSHVQMEKHGSEAENIRMSMFSYEKDDDKFHGMEGRGRGRGRRRGRGRGRGRW